MHKHSVVLIMLFPLSLLSGGCGGCAGCSYIFPQISQAAAEIKREYLSAESRMSSYYEEKALPLEKDIKKLEREITRSWGKLEVLAKSGLVVDESTMHHLELMKRNYKLQGDIAYEHTHK